jgi:hypothetical protein
MGAPTWACGSTPSPPTPGARHLDTTWIDHVERRMERPSDHAALTADFDLAAVGLKR